MTTVAWEKTTPDLGQAKSIDLSDKSPFTSLNCRHEMISVTQCESVVTAFKPGFFLVRFSGIEGKWNCRNLEFWANFCLSFGKILEF